MRRAKIVCTLGPAVSSEDQIRELVESGMDVARLNMSHGTHEQHRRAYNMVRKAADTTGHGVGIFADLQGPKIRLGRFTAGPVQLAEGAEFTITTRDVLGDVRISSTTSVPYSSTSFVRLPIPMPCSPVHVPPTRSARSIIAS